MPARQVSIMESSAISGTVPHEPMLASFPPVLTNSWTSFDFGQVIPGNTVEYPARPSSGGDAFQALSHSSHQVISDLFDPDEAGWGTWG
jgi:hypothetical protein